MMIQKKLVDCSALICDRENQLGVLLSACEGYQHLHQILPLALQAPNPLFHFY